MFAIMFIFLYGRKRGMYSLEEEEQDVAFLAVQKVKRAVQK